MLLVVVAMTLDVAVITLEFEILLGTATLAFDTKIQVALNVSKQNMHLHKTYLFDLYSMKLI